MLRLQVVYQPYLQEFLSAVTGNNSSSGGGDSGAASMEEFADAVFDALSPDTLDLGALLKSAKGWPGPTWVGSGQQSTHTERAQSMYPALQTTAQEDQ